MKRRILLLYSIDITSYSLSQGCAGFVLRDETTDLLKILETVIELQRSLQV